MTMSMDALHLTLIPTVNVGMLIRRPPEEVFQAFVDPAISTKFWFTVREGAHVDGEGPSGGDGSITARDTRIMRHCGYPVPCLADT
jgi:hypothetical protein